MASLFYPHISSLIERQRIKPRYRSVKQCANIFLQHQKSLGSQNKFPCKQNIAVQKPGTSPLLGPGNKQIVVHLGTKYRFSKPPSIWKPKPKSYPRGDPGSRCLAPVLKIFPGGGLVCRSSDKCARSTAPGSSKPPIDRSKSRLRYASVAIVAPNCGSLV